MGDMLVLHDLLGFIMLQFYCAEG